MMKLAAHATAPDAHELLTAASAKMAIVSKHISEASKIYKVIKKIHDTSFLQLYNDMSAAA